MAKHDQVSDEEARWNSSMQRQVTEYVALQSISHGQIGEAPAWSIFPCVSIWAIESGNSPVWVGWWVICGDCWRTLLFVLHCRLAAFAGAVVGGRKCCDPGEHFDGTGDWRTAAAVAARVKHEFQSSVTRGTKFRRHAHHGDGGRSPEAVAARSAREATTYDALVACGFSHPKRMPEKYQDIDRVGSVGGARGAGFA
jgi:hypothetical protein